MAWLRGTRGNGNDRRLSDWRRAWTDAAAAPDASRLAALRASLDTLAAPDEDLEIEREMIEALESLLALMGSVGDGALPVVETGHRVVGTDRCHFSVPASRPDEETQPSGRLILTERRAIFAGGGRALTLPWHGVGAVLQDDREILLVRIDRETVHRFRCNNFGDALCGAFLGRRLSRDVRSAARRL